MRGQCYDVWREFLARRLLWLFAVVIGLSLLLVWGSSGTLIERQQELEGISDIRSLDLSVGFALLRGLNFYAGLLVFLSVMAAAGSIPRMLQRGRAEFYLARPVSRTTLLGTRFAALVLVYGAVVLTGTLLMVALLTLRFGFYGSSLVWIPLGNLLALVVWLGIVCLLGIVSGSGTMAVVGAFLVWLAQFLLRFGHLAKSVLAESTIGRIVEILYLIFPKTSELADITVKLAAGQMVPSWLPVWSTALVGLAALWLAMAVFRRRSY